jgi:hypothetical protein
MPRRLICLLFALVGLLAGCGGGDSSSTGVPTAAEVTSCVIGGGGQKWGQTPIQPKGFPSHLESSVTVGPEFAHITVYISRRPAFNQNLAEGFDEIGEYQATVLYGGRGLLLLDHDIKKKDKELASECIEA